MQQQNDKTYAFNSKSQYIDMIEQRNNKTTTTNQLKENNVQMKTKLSTWQRSK